MPRPKKVPNHAVPFPGVDGNGETVPDSDPSRFSSVPGVQAFPSRIEQAFEALCELLTRDDGWLRVVPHGNGETVYWKWKFSRGKHENHYVMFRADCQDTVGGILGLESKVNDVDVGVRRPALDTPYG